LSEPAPTFQRSFPADPEAPAVARHALKAFLHEHGVDPWALADVLLAVSEVVTNCVAHAYRGKPGGRVALEARRTGDTLLLTVADRGRGMAARPDSPGLGLGLSLVGRIARSVDISARDGGGTREHVVRPRPAVDLIATGGPWRARKTRPIMPVCRR
jgi:anti-sigma regulatory factor (Ser/Thr protein kinase)